MSSDLPGDTDWMVWAKCRGVDPAFFFPAHGGTGEEQKAYCLGTDDGPVCMVRLRCLEYAINSHEGGCVWGGMSERQRRKIRRERRRRRVDDAHCL